MAEPKILAATSKELAAPDWSLNMEICDYCNSNIENGAKEVVEILQHRLNNKNKKICYLSLILAEALMKNCGPPLHKKVCDKTFLDFVANLGRGRKGEENQMKALQLIQSWAFSFKKQKAEYPLFSKLYGAMKTIDDLTFGEERDVELFEPLMEVPTVEVSRTAENYGGTPFDKLENELNEVHHHCDRYEKLLKKYFNDELEDEDQLLDEEDYLLQCRPRIKELIEAGSVGLFPDAVYEHCFLAFDNTNRVLELKETGIVSTPPKKTKKRKNSSPPSEEAEISEPEKEVDDEDIDLFFKQRATSTADSNQKDDKKPEKKVPEDDAMAILDDILNA